MILRPPSIRSRISAAPISCAGRYKAAAQAAAQASAQAAAQAVAQPAAQQAAQPAVHSTQGEGPRQAGRSDFGGLVLGCIEAKFCRYYSNHVCSVFVDL